MSADALESPMSGASTHLIVISWTSANTFRRSMALDLKRRPGRERRNPRYSTQRLGATPAFFEAQRFRIACLLRQRDGPVEITADFRRRVRVR